MNNRFVRFAVAGLSLALLPGCASETAPTSSQPSTTRVTSPSSASPSSASATPQPAATTGTLTREQTVYLSQLRKAHASLLTAPDEGLIGIGEGVCTFYDNGSTSSEVNNFLMTAAGVAYTLQEFAAMHGAAVGAFCPEHVDKIGAE